MVTPRSTAHGHWYIDSGHFECFSGAIAGFYIFAARAPYEKHWRATLELDAGASLIGYGRSAPAAIQAAFDLLSTFKLPPPPGGGASDPGQLR